jgi:hypothetical protein
VRARTHTYFHIGNGPWNTSAHNSAAESMSVAAQCLYRSALNASAHQGHSNGPSIQSKHEPPMISRIAVLAPPNTALYTRARTPLTAYVPADRPTYILKSKYTIALASHVTSGTRKRRLIKQSVCNGYLCAGLQDLRIRKEDAFRTCTMVQVCRPGGTSAPERRSQRHIDTKQRKYAKQ